MGGELCLEVRQGERGGRFGGEDLVWVCGAEDAARARTAGCDVRPACVVGYLETLLRGRVFFAVGVRHCGGWWFGGCAERGEKLVGVWWGRGLIR